MIRNPEFPDGATIIKEMMSDEATTGRVNGPMTTPEEDLEMRTALRRIADTNPLGFQILCVACHTPSPLLESAACACGGFVCAACQRIEDEGVCDHTPFPLPSGADDDEPEH